MFDVTFTAADLEQLTATQLDAIVEFCWDLEFQYDLDLRETIQFVRVAKAELLERAWTDTSPRVWA
jgi:hypothetical protein